MTTTIRQAELRDLPQLVPLFDAYRQFYRYPADPALAERFLADRIGRRESIIFLATDPVTGAGLGFTQLYPTFCSTAAIRLLVLYDLFVAPEGRRHGIGRQLMERAHHYAREEGFGRVMLQTAHTNTGAQALYESLGYRHDTEFRVYELVL
ncbi:MAG TPA: GNAT family N-acetyltransferase [Gemmatimonadales bacterium]|nr:GNAT family N-acetyltransferase [Gemmatimonadales bacterium]